MNHPSGKKARFPLSLCVIVFAALWLTAFIQKLILSAGAPDFSPVFNALAGTVVFAGLFYLYQNRLWKFRLSKRWGAGAYPNLNGRWVGFLNSSFKQGGQNMIVPVTLEIHQTASSVSVRACFEKAQSECVIADFETIKDRLFLCYLYDNTLDGKVSGTASHDRGAVMLEYFEKDKAKTLKGYYFNDLKPVPNYGEIKVSLAEAA